MVEKVEVGFKSLYSLHLGYRNSTHMAFDGVMNDIDSTTLRHEG